MYPTVYSPILYSWKVRPLDGGQLPEEVPSIVMGFDWWHAQMWAQLKAGEHPVFVDRAYPDRRPGRRKGHTARCDGR